MNNDTLVVWVLLTIFLYCVCSDGGRLQEELEYSKSVLGEGYGSTNELVIQTGERVLTPEGMLRHLKAMQAATKVTVQVFDREWSLRDLCMTAGSLSIEDGVFDFVSICHMFVALL